LVTSARTAACGDTLLPGATAHTFLCDMSDDMRKSILLRVSASLSLVSYSALVDNDFSL